MVPVPSPPIVPTEYSATTRKPSLVPLPVSSNDRISPVSPMSVAALSPMPMLTRIKRVKPLHNPGTTMPIPEYVPTPATRTSPIIPDPNSANRITVSPEPKPTILTPTPFHNSITVKPDPSLQPPLPSPTEPRLSLWSMSAVSEPPQV